MTELSYWILLTISVHREGVLVKISCMAKIPRKDCIYLIGLNKQLYKARPHNQERTQFVPICVVALNCGLFRTFFF